MKHGSMSRRGLLLFAAMCVIWGIPYLFIRVAVKEISPATLVLARTAIAAALLLPIAAFRRELRPVLPRWAPLLAFTTIEIAVPWILLGSAEQHVSSSLTGLLIAGVPLVGAVVALTTGTRERFGLQRGAGLLLGVAGVAALVGVNVGGTRISSLAEIGLVVVGYAVGPFILQRPLSDLPALGVIAASLGITMLAYIPIAVFSLPARLPSAKVVGSVVALGVVCTAIAFLVFFALVAEIGPARAGVITYVNPAVAAALGVGLLGERFTPGMGVGFALVLVGSALATRHAQVPATSAAALDSP